MTTADSCADSLPTPGWVGWVPWDRGAAGVPGVAGATASSVVVWSVRIVAGWGGQRHRQGLHDHCGPVQAGSGGRRPEPGRAVRATPYPRHLLGRLGRGGRGSTVVARPGRLARPRLSVVAGRPEPWTGTRNCCAAGSTARTTIIPGPATRPPPGATSDGHSSSDQAPEATGLVPMGPGKSFIAARAGTSSRAC